MLKKALAFLVVLSFIFFGKTALSEPNCDNPGFGDLDYCIQKIQTEIDALKPAHEYNKKELNDLRTQISGLEKRINTISAQVNQLEKDIRDREEDLGYAKVVFEEKTDNHYRFIRLYDSLIPFFAAIDASEFFKEINFQKKAAEEDRFLMEKYGIDLVKLNSDKDNLEKNKKSLAAAKSAISKREEFLAGEVAKTESYLQKLSGKQNELSALKAGGFQTSVGDTPATLEPCSGPPGSSNFCDPGFRPAYSAFSFGAPHRTGMSQYGSFGRSKSGQSAEQILSAYFVGSELKKDFSSPATIGVVGYGRLAFEENYLLGIYEVPEKWGDEGGFEALKAQAVAARSFALAATNNGSGNICVTESCQVYKPQLKSGKWAEAVRATRGWVLFKGGSVAKAYYASTAGGFTIDQWGWSGIKDAKDNDWPGGAYEKISGSPWFYKGWYKSRGGATCGRGNPWLTSAEMADIINAWSVLYQGGGDVSRISPVDRSCWGGNPYSNQELAGVGGYSAVNGVSVVYANSGSTLQVVFDTNKGSATIKGEELKKAFNLRAPGYVGIKSSLFNIEKL